MIEKLAEILGRSGRGAASVRRAERCRAGRLGAAFPAPDDGDQTTEEDRMTVPF